MLEARLPAVETRLEAWLPAVETRLEARLEARLVMRVGCWACVKSFAPLMGRGEFCCFCPAATP